MSDEELLYLMMCGNEWAMEELYYSYSRYVRNIAREISCRNQCLIELEEMVAEISMIFMNILYQYRSDKNASLSTFFKKCVRYRIYTMLKQYYSQLKSVPLSIDEYIIDEKTYKRDYESITEGLLFEKVSYDRAIKSLQEIVNSDFWD